MLGNPYPSTINWNSEGITYTNVDNAIYVYNDDGSHNFDNYDYYMRGSVGSPYPLIALNASADSCHIAPNQSVFVRANAGGASVTITNESRRHRPTTFYKSKSVHPDLMILAVKNGNTSDETAIRFIPEATKNYDGEFDAIKRYHSAGKVPQVSSVTSICEMAINTLSEITDNLIIPLNLRIYQEAKYTFELQEFNFDESVDAYLVDKERNKRTDFNKTSDYTVKLKQGKYTDRFYIIFKKETQIEEEKEEIISDISEITEENVEIFSYKDDITIKLISVKSEKIYVTIQDVLGRKIVSKLLTSDNTTIPMSRFASGNYIVKVITDKGIYEQKVFVE